MNSLLKKIGIAIEEKLAEKKISIEQLEIKSGLTREVLTEAEIIAILNGENTELDLITLGNFAEALGIQPYELLK